MIEFRPTPPVVETPTEAGATGGAVAEGGEFGSLLAASLLGKPHSGSDEANNGDERGAKSGTELWVGAPEPRPVPAIVPRPVFPRAVPASGGPAVPAVPDVSTQAGGHPQLEPAPQPFVLQRGAAPAVPTVRSRSGTSGGVDAAAGPPISTAERLSPAPGASATAAQFDPIGEGPPLRAAPVVQLHGDGPVQPVGAGQATPGVVPLDAGPTIRLAAPSPKQLELSNRPTPVSASTGLPAHPGSSEIRPATLAHLAGGAEPAQSAELIASLGMRYGWAPQPGSTDPTSPASTGAADPPAGGPMPHPDRSDTGALSAPAPVPSPGTMSPASGVAAPAQPAEPQRQASIIATRIARSVEILESMPPPRSMVVDLSEFGGVRITVSLRGDLVHIGSIGADTLPAVLRPWLDEIGAALVDRGFQLHGSLHEQRGRSAPRDREDGPDTPRPDRRRSVRRGSPGLRI